MTWSHACPFLVQIVWWWKIEERYSSEMQSQAEVFGGEPGAKAKADLQSRVTEHNILVVSKYYAQLRVSRLATLLDLPEDKVGRVPCKFEDIRL